MLIVVQHRQKNDFEADGSRVIFIKSEQNLYQSYDLKSVTKKQSLTDF